MTIDLLLRDHESHAPVLSEPLADESAGYAPRPEVYAPSVLSAASYLDVLPAQGWGVIVEQESRGPMLAWIDELMRVRAAQCKVRSAPVFAVPRAMDHAQARAWRITSYERIPVERRPRYLLILGDLDQVSLELQRELEAHACVGRLCFRDVDGTPRPEQYRAYCSKLLASEHEYLDWNQRARLLFFCARDGSPATDAGFRDLVRRSFYEARKDRGLAADDIRIFGRPDELGWDTESTVPEVRERVLTHWAESAHPSVLLSMCHGAGVRDDAARQRARQGGLWLRAAQTRDPVRILDGAYFAGRRFLRRGFWLIEACFGAGTAAASVYRPWLERLSARGRHAEDPADALAYLGPHGPFVAQLPQVALANPFGPLAILGHVDLTWSHGYQRTDEPGIASGAEHSPYYALLRSVANGSRFGAAMLQTIVHKASAIGTHLATLYGEREAPEGEDGDQADATARAGSEVALRGWQWMRYHSLSGYILLGDPAARLPVQAARVALHYETALAELLVKPRQRPTRREPVPATRDPDPRSDDDAPDGRGLAPSHELPVCHLPLEFIPTPARHRERSDENRSDNDDQRVYLLRDPDAPGSYLAGELVWDESLRADLSGLTDLATAGRAIANLSASMERFAGSAGWTELVRRVRDGRARGRAVVLTVRSAAHELYALPWEFLAIRGVPLCDTLDCLVRYESPGAGSPAAANPSPPDAGDRILVAWAGAVPAHEHIAVIARAARASDPSCFSPERDQLAHASPTSLADALAARAKERPVTVLHLLCHGRALAGGASYGLALEGEDGLLGPEALRALLEPHARHLRLVVLAACMSGHPGAADNQVGSLARAIHDAGVPAIIASRYPLTLAGSVTLTRSLYRALLVDLRSLEGALLEVRARLHEDREEGWDWAAVQWYGRSALGTEYRPIVVRPYRGLLPYERAHSRFFFGRTRERRELVERVRAAVQRLEPRFLVVAGTSGAGKSSLIHAGFIPDLLAGRPGDAIHDDGRDDGHVDGRDDGRDDGHVDGRDDGRDDESWTTASMRVTRDHAPVARLHAVLAEHRAARPESGRAAIALVVDRLEDLFTEVADPEAQRAFMVELWRLASDPGGEVFVIVALRTEYLARLAGLCVDPTGTPFDRQALAAERLYLVPRPGPDEYRAIAEKPCRLAGVHVEPGLREQVVRDLGAEPGALPLLSFVMDQLWNERISATREVHLSAPDAPGERVPVTGWWLTDDAYERLGGIGGALTQAATRLMARLTEEQGVQVRRVLVQLVHGHADPNLVTRRRGYRRLLRPGLDAPIEARAFDQAIDALIEAHLLVQGTDPDASASADTPDGERDPRGPWLELAHDVLARSWPGLRDWYQDARAWLAQTDELRAAAHAWAESVQIAAPRDERDEPAGDDRIEDQHENPYLLRGQRLSYHLESWKRHGHHLGAEDRRTIQAFLDACESARRAREERERQRLERERALREEAELERDRAEQQMRLAVARNQVVESQRALEEGRPAHALDRAMAAVRTTADAGEGVIPAAYAALYAALQHTGGQPLPGPVLGLAPDGTRAIVARRDATRESGVSAWSWPLDHDDDATPPRRFSGVVEIREYARKVAIQPRLIAAHQGQILATSRSELWNLREPERPPVALPDALAWPLVDGVFSQDDRWLFLWYRAVEGTADQILRWDVADPSAPRLNARLAMPPPPADVRATVTGQGQIFATIMPPGLGVLCARRWDKRTELLHWPAAKGSHGASMDDRVFTSTPPSREPVGFAYRIPGSMGVMYADSCLETGSFLGLPYKNEGFVFTPSSAIKSAAFTRIERVLFVGSSLLVADGKDARVGWYKWRGERDPWQWLSGHDEPTQAIYSGAGGVVATRDSTGHSRLWRATDQRRWASEPRVVEEPNSVIHFAEPHEWPPELDIAPVPRPVTGWVVSPDFRTLAYWNERGLWLAPPTRAGDLDAHIALPIPVDTPVRQAGFTEDGRELLTVHQGATLRWRLRIEDLMDVARSVAWTGASEDRDEANEMPPP